MQTRRSSEEKLDVPSGINVHLVLLRPTLLAVILIRALRLVEDAHAAAVLPHAAAVALDEEAARVVVLRIRRPVGLAERRAGIFLLSAETPRHLLFVLGGLFVRLLRGAEHFGLGGGVGALAAARRLAHLFA